MGRLPRSARHTVRGGDLQGIQSYVEETAVVALGLFPEERQIVPVHVASQSQRLAMGARWANE